MRPIPFRLLFCPFNKSLLSLRLPGVRPLQRSRRVGVVSRFSTGQGGRQTMRFSTILRQCHPLLGNPQFQRILLSVVGEKEDAKDVEVAKAIQKRFGSISTAVSLSRSLTMKSRFLNHFSPFPISILFSKLKRSEEADCLPPNFPWKETTLRGSEIYLFTSNLVGNTPSQRFLIAKSNLFINTLK